MELELIIRELDSKNKEDEKILLEIVRHEDEVFGEGSIGKWNVKPFCKYGKIFAQLTKAGELVSVIEVLRSFDGDIAYLYGVSSVKKYENKGYTKRILNYVMEYLKKSGIKKVELTVSTENIRAISLYKKFDFVIKEELDDEYGDGNKRYLMTCDIKTLTL